MLPLITALSQANRSLGLSDRMLDLKDHESRQVGLMALLLVMYVAISLLFTQVFGDPEVHSHFAYIPLVLAGLWWGHRGVVVAILLVLTHLIFHVTGLTTFSWWTEIEMTLSYLVVGSFFGVVGERMKRGARDLKTSQQKYSQLVEKSLTGIFVYRDQVILFVNPRLASMLRYRPEELVGRSVWDLIYPDDLAEVRARFQAREEGGYSDLRYETRLLRSDGTAAWVDVASTRMAFEGEISVQVNVSDITERKIAEQRERELEELARQQEEQLVHSARLAELGELAASVAHEVNQPLTGIRNYARNAVYMLEHEAGEREDLLENLDRIAAQVDRAAQIIRLLQQLSRRSDREKEPIDVNGLLNECVEFFETKLRLAGIRVELDLDEDLPQFSGDRIRIEQVFLNLLTNAIHALSQVEQRRLTIRTARESGERLMIEFSDTGTGFANADRQKLFRPFYTTRQNGQGTGLGLPIALSVVEEHQGTIEAIGEPGRGATFKIRFPVEPRTEGRTSHVRRDG